MNLTGTYFGVRTSFEFACLSLLLLWLSLARNRSLHRPSALFLIPLGYLLLQTSLISNPILGEEVFRFAMIIALMGLLASLMPEFAKPANVYHISICLVWAAVAAVIVDTLLPPLQVTAGRVSFLFPGNFQGDPLAWAGFAQPNNFASFLACVVSTLFILKILFNVQGNRFIWVLTLVSGSALVSVANSKVGVLGLIVSSILFSGYGKIVSCNHREVFAGACSIAAGLTAVWLTDLFPSGVDKLISEVASETISRSSSVRLGSYLFALDQWLDAPWFGHGFGSWLTLLQQAIVDGRQLELSWASGLVFNFLHPHSELLHWTTQFGLIGTSLLLLPWFIWYWMTVKSPSYRVVAFLALIPVLLHAGVEMPLESSGLHWFLLIVIPSLFADHSESLGNPLQKLGRFADRLRTRTPMVLVSAALTIVFLWAAYDRAQLSFYYRNQATFLSNWMSAVESGERLVNSPVNRNQASAIFNQMVAKIFIEYNDKRSLELLLPSLEHAFEASPNLVYYNTLIAAYEHLEVDREDALRARFMTVKAFNEKKFPQ